MPSHVQVWEAVQELKAEAAWKIESIMECATAFEAQLATGQSHDLPALQAPKQPPVDSSLSASEVALSSNVSQHEHTCIASMQTCPYQLPDPANLL